MIRKFVWHRDSIIPPHHVVPYATLALFCLASIAILASQPPAPSATQFNRPPQEQANSNQRESDIERDLTVRIAKSDQETTDEQDARNQEAANNRRMVWLTAAIAALTFGLIVVAWAQRQTTEATLATNKIVERAYVKVSHEWAEGDTSPMAFMPADTNDGVAHLISNITVKNEGRTPADVLGGCVWGHAARAGEKPSAIPSPNAFRVEPAFLTGGGGDFIRAVAKAPLQRAYGSGDQLWLVGYVDYRDRFGDFHRTGYCRHFVPPDLVFDQTTTGLNYDRPLSKEERRVYPTEN